MKVRELVASDFTESRAFQEYEARFENCSQYTAALDAYCTANGELLEAIDRRSLSVGDSTAGGYLLPPPLRAMAVKKLDDTNPIRALARKFTIRVEHGFQAPSLDAEPDDADWTSELATGSEDDAMQTGLRELYPWPLAKRIKLSNKFLSRGGESAASLVTERLAVKHSVAAEKAYMTGNGVSKPLGVFTASDAGIPTSRDVSAGNTTTAVTGEGLLNCMFSLREPYLRSPSLRWVFHRDTIKQLMAADLADGTSIVEWIDGVCYVHGVRAELSEYAPNTFTTGLYVGIVGDFQHYWIADSLEFTIQRLVERHAATNQSEFIGRLETDGMPVVGEAFARVKLADA